MKPGTSLAIFVFAVVALAHILRLAFNVPVTIGTWNVPMWSSLLGAIFAGGLAVALWRENRLVGTPGKP